LAARECGGNYDDAILILSSVMSALAASLWPGSRIDRQRTVELWIRYAAPHLKTTRVSVPLLAEYLRDTNDRAPIASLANARPEAFRDFPDNVDTLVIEGDDVDMEESEIQTTCPTIAVTTIREYSYPNLFYREVRSPYVHEYSPGERASRYPGGHRTTAVISYLNSLPATNTPDAKGRRPSFRKIHFNVDWLANMIDSIGERVVYDWSAGKQPPPPKWWVDGA
jgi:hypothetical protein